MQHNLIASQDDEYLKAILGIYLRSHYIADRQTQAKVEKAFEEGKSIYDMFFGENMNSDLVNENGLFITPPVQLDRFTNIFEKIARGIYFHHFEHEKWSGEVDVFPFSLTLMLGESVNTFRMPVDSWKKFFMGETRYGNNPLVFYYQITQIKMGKIVRFVFYEDFEVGALLE